MKSIFSKIATIVCCLAPMIGFAQNATLLTTVTNPATRPVELFGRTVAAMGSDRLLVGAPYALADEETAGAVYLFSTNGNLLGTFANPKPYSDAEFGRSIAVVGSDRLFIGAPGDHTGAGYAGVVHLISTNSTLLLTITNPTPAEEEYFGSTVAVLGSDRVLIGAPREATRAPYGGAAYLYSTNGTLLTAILNPSSTPLEESFGSSVAAVGNDRLLIGAPYAGYQGAAYLFSTNGTLLTTLSQFHPAPSGRYNAFGWSVAAFGNDRVLIGAPWTTTSVGYAGMVYLFQTNGTLLTTFTNPIPEFSGWFGHSVAAIGSDRVLIGANSARAAYLFSTNGALLAVFNLSSANESDFGQSVAALGSDRVLIGSGAEKAYLFGINTQPPSLSVTRSGGNVTVSWPRPADSFVLDETPALAPLPAATDWSPVPIATYQTNASSIFISVPTPTGNKFFRLRRP